MANYLVASTVLLRLSLTSFIIVILTPNNYFNNITTNYKPIIVSILLISILSSKVLPLIGIIHTVDIRLKD